MEEDIIKDYTKEVGKLRDIDDIYSVPWKALYKKNYELDFKGRILIINTPCMGFGDIVYAMKLKSYLKEWYPSSTIIIATTQPSKFVTLGENLSELIYMRSRSSKDQCRKLKFLHLYDEKGALDIMSIPRFDLIFVAPLTADFQPEYEDVRYIVPYSNRFNTFFFSEYNDSFRKPLDFHTGVGGYRMGLFLNTFSELKPLDIKNPYVVIYVASTITAVKKCVLSFLEMVCKKYDYQIFEVILPLNILNLVRENLDILRGDYPQIIEGKEMGIDAKEGKTLIFRTDIFPLSNKDMISLMKYSVKDILLTGDQSITDAISCCEDKNIFYQIAPWKENFGRNLALEMPNRFLKKKSTSCGTFLALNYRSDYKNFKTKWDFRVLAKPKLDSILLASVYRKMYKKIKFFEFYISSAKNLNLLQERVYTSFSEEKQ